MLSVIVVHTEAVQWQWTGIWQSFLFTGLLYGLHVWLNFTRPRTDQVVLPLVGVIMALGLVMIQRLEPALAAVSEGRLQGIANKQVIWITVGMLALWVTVTFVDDDVDTVTVEPSIDVTVKVPSPTDFTVPRVNAVLPPLPGN